jgi:DNA-binding CsgD family transcriptional regulator
MLDAGHSMDAIAAELGLSRNTVGITDSTPLGP